MRGGCITIIKKSKYYTYINFDYIAKNTKRVLLLFGYSSILEVKWEKGFICLIQKFYSSFKLYTYKFTSSMIIKAKFISPYFMCQQLAGKSSY